MTKLSNHNNVEQLSNGLFLGFESRYQAPIVSISMLLPAGVIHDLSHASGVILNEMLFRGAGLLDGRSQMLALEHIGARRSTYLGLHHICIQMTVLEEQFEKACNLLSDIVFGLHLTKKSFDAAKALAIQNIASLDDNPQENVMLVARKNHLPYPYNQNSYGDLNGLKNINIDSVRNYKSTCFVPNGSWIGVAGSIKWVKVQNQIKSNFSNWKGICPSNSIVKGFKDCQKIIEVPQNASQVHIALMCDGGSSTDIKEIVMNQIMTRILGGATSGRLFSEIRERNSLCYSVGSSYGVDKRFAIISTYAGTTADRALKTIELMLLEFRKIKKGVSLEEFNRAKTGLVSKILFSGESTIARAGAISSDLFRYGHIRSLENKVNLVMSITHEEFQDFLSIKKFGTPTLAHIGSLKGSIDKELILDD